MYDLQRKCQIHRILYPGDYPLEKPRDLVGNENESVLRLWEELERIYYKWSARVAANL